MTTSSTGFDSGPPRPGTVLHVIHGLGSGVEQVVLDYVRATPELAHHVVYSVEPSCHAKGWAESVGFVSAEQVDGRAVRFTRAVRRVNRSVAPDLVHAHSSVAGAVTRAALPRATIVYTPHCFAFVRQDKSTLERAVFWAVEALLARRTRALAACSRHEAQLARRFVRGSRVHYVPNIASVEELPPPTARTDGQFRVTASGRISPQKDPATFAALAADVRRRHPTGVAFVWIGSGPAALTAQLESAGVRVTGWLPRSEAMSHMAGSDLYVHTARWEATPLTILEAARLGVPVLARSTAPIRAMGLDEPWTTRAELVDRVEELIRGRGLDALGTVNDRLLEEHRPQHQSASLRHCYGSARRSLPSPDVDTRITREGVRA